MVHQKIYFSAFLVSFFLLIACGGKSPPIEANKYKKVAGVETSESISYETIRTSGPPVLLITTATTNSLRAAPSLKAKEIRRLSKNDTLIYTNELSAESMAIQLEGIEYEEPWLRVLSKGSNEKAWIFGGCVRFAELDNKQLSELLFSKRLGKLFGDQLANQVLNYHREMQDVQTISAFRKLYLEGIVLKTVLENAINEHLAKANTELIPDFFWLQGTFAGFLVSYPPQINEYRLFADFKHWKKLAQQTPSNEDNLFVDVMLEVYSSDSTEFLFQDWRYELPTGEAYSLLGQGIHLSVLDKIYMAIREDSLGFFKKELASIKQELIDDISLSNQYWSPKEAIVKELENILDRTYPFIKQSNRIELQARLKMLKEAEKYGISTNHYEY